jgi:hypothetical protein
MSLIHHVPSRKLSREANWLVATRPWSDSSGPSAEELLRQGASLRGNSRLVRTGEGIARMADVYVDDTDDGAAQAEGRLALWFDGAPATVRPDAELVESLLAERGLKVERRDEAWIVSGEQVAGVTLRHVDGGCRVEGLLLELDVGVMSTQRMALAEFLCRAQEGLRFVRAELGDSSALVVAWCDLPTLSGDLDHALGGVSWACRQLIAQVKSLTHVALAESYLDFVVGRVADDGGGELVPPRPSAVSGFFSSESQTQEIQR